MSNQELSFKEKNSIVFLRQQGLSIQYISKVTGINEYFINRLLDKIYKSENYIFVSKSLEIDNLYFVLVNKSERELKVDPDLYILNKIDFDNTELKVIQDLYGFRI